MSYASENWRPAAMTSTRLGCFEQKGYRVPKTTTNPDKKSAATCRIPPKRDIMGVFVRLIIHTKVRSVSGAFSLAEEVHELGKKVTDGGTGALWFRGHADETWELKPSAGRGVEYGGLYDPKLGPDRFHID